MDFHTFAAGDRPIRRAGLPRSRLAAGLALALLGLASGRAHAKAELRIVVVDSLTSLPVQGAAVELRTQAGDALWRGSSDAGETGFGNFAMAAVHLALDEREQAAATLRARLQAAVRQGTALPPVVGFEPLYDDPDFLRIVREAGFQPPDLRPASPRTER